MTPEEFRTAGHELIDWIADYRLNLASGPVKAAVEPGEVRAQFEAVVDPAPRPFSELLRELDHVVVPGVMQVQHPMHFGWFPSNASLSSVLGDIASSGIGSLSLSWESSPSSTEVEEVVVDWMRQATGLSSEWEGTIHDTASTSCLVALLAARERASGHSQADGGFQSLPAALVVYTTEQAHSSVVKAALLAGYGRENLRVVAHDRNDFSMDPDALATAMAADAADGRVPCAVVAAVGTTGTTAIDPIAAVVKTAAQHGAWVHVDAAMAGSAMLLPECRHLFDGVEGADSLTWNPHKWMGTILDCSLFYVRESQHLIRVMSTNPSYLQSNVDGQVTQYRDWGIPLGRRFRSLKLLFQLRLDGLEAIQGRLRRDIANAKWLAEQVEAAPGWSVLAPVTLQTVCVRYDPGSMTDEERDDFTLRWARGINDSGKAFVSPSVLEGSWMVRVSVGVEGTERSHVEQLWALMNEAVAV